MDSTIGVWSLFFKTFVLLLFVSLGDSRGLVMSDEKRLIKHLVDNYAKIGRVGRPVYNTTETVKTNFGVALIQILELREREQVLKTSLWLRHLWKDILLQWEPEDFGGVDHVRLPINSIWSPDLVLYNSNKDSEYLNDAMAVVSSDGTVLWIPRVITESACSIDVTNFPYDTQTCMLKYGSWTYDGFKLDVDFYDGLEEVDVSDYIESNEFALVGHPAVKNVKYYPCCEEPYPDLTFTLKLQRVAAFYNYVVLYPSVLLSASVLLIFVQPPSFADRSHYAIALFAAFFLLLLILSEVLPRAASSMPLLGDYFVCNMILIVLSMLISAFIIFVYNLPGDRPLPTFLERMICCRGNYPKQQLASNCDYESEALQEKKKNGIGASQQEKKETTNNGWMQLATWLDRIMIIIYLVLDVVLYICFIPK